MFEWIENYFRRPRFSTENLWDTKEGLQNPATNNTEILNPKSKHSVGALRNRKMASYCPEIPKTRNGSKEVFRRRGSITDKTQNKPETPSRQTNKHRSRNDMEKNLKQKNPEFSYREAITLNLKWMKNQGFVLLSDRNEWSQKPQNSFIVTLLFIFWIFALSLNSANETSFTLLDKAGVSDVDSPGQKSP